MKIKAVPVNEENFKPYGVYTRIIRGEARTGEGGWRAWTSPGLAMEHNAHFGMTKVAGMPFSVDSMERHTKSTERRYVLWFFAAQDGKKSKSNSKFAHFHTALFLRIIKAR